MDTSSQNNSAIEKKNISKGVFLGLSAVILILLIQGVFHPFKTIELAGAEHYTERAPFTISNVESGEFQRTQERWYSKHFGFREWFVRGYNQCLYSVFGECTPQVIIGKDGYLFEASYASSIRGDDFVGNSRVQLQVDSLRQINTWLSAQGKHLVVMIAPNKWRYFKDKLPAEFQYPEAETNYSAYSKALRSSGIHFLDWVSGFDHLSAGKPLMSKQGTHWSVFGASRVAHMLNGSLYKRGITEASVVVTKVESLAEPRFTDKDLHDLLNVLQKPSDEQLDYPTFELQGHGGPRALVIGDSYYWTFYYLNLHQLMWAPESKFFYYNKSLVSDDRNQQRPIEAKERINELEQSDVVLLLMGEGSLKYFGFGFLKDAYAAKEKE